MAAREATVARILDALVVAADRQGDGRVSVTDVCREAGISRGTLYRYFPTRQHLLDALDAHALDLYRKVIDDAVARDPAVGHRVRVVVRAVAALAGDGSRFRLLYRSDPVRVLGYLRSNWDDIVAVLRDALAPAFEDADTGRGTDTGTDTDTDADADADTGAGSDADAATVAADVVARHLFSRELIPSDHTSTEALVALIETWAHRPDPRNRTLL